MALNWYVDKIKNYKEYCWQDDGYLEPITEKLIWKTMQIGMPEITEKNWKQFYLRVNFIEKHTGASMRTYNERTKTWEDYYMTPKTIYKHIGLQTNADRITDTKFWKQAISQAEKYVSEK